MDTTFQKIKKAYSVKTNSELAEQLNTTRGAVEGWSRRNEVPHKYLIECTLDTGVSLDWLLNNDKPTFHTEGEGNIGQQNIHGGKVKNFVKDKNLPTKSQEIEVKLFEENNPVFLSFQKAYEKVKSEKDKLNELEDLLEDFYRKYR